VEEGRVGKGVDLEKLVRVIAEELLKANGLHTGQELKLADSELIERGFTYTLGEAGICVEEFGDGYWSVYVVLLYDKLCKLGEFPPKYPISLSLEFIERSPFGRNKWLLSAIAASLERFFERVDMEFEVWGDFYEDFKDLSELRRYIEEEWVKGMEINVLSANKLKVLEKIAPHVYEDLLNALKVVNTVKLWITDDLTSVSLAAVEDVTGIGIEELRGTVARLIREAGEAQRRLIEIYREEAERALSRVPRSRVIEVEVDPCAAREWCVGGWVLASW